MSYTHKENLLKSRSNEIEKELREGRVKSKVLVAEHKRKINDQEDKIKDLLQKIKYTKSINTTEK